MAFKDLLKRIEKEKQKKEQYEKRIKLLNNRMFEIKRREDTRKKILVGSYILNELERNGNIKEMNMNSLRDGLNSFLVRPNDRGLFALPTMEEKS